MTFVHFKGPIVYYVLGGGGGNTWGVRFLKAVKIGGYIFVMAWGTNSDCFKMLKMFNPPKRNAAYRQF